MATSFSGSAGSALARNANPDDFGGHPPSRRATSCRACFTAMSSAVSPSAVRTDRSAPRSRRRRTRARSPLNAASCSGVWPAGEPRPSTGQPRVMRSRTISGRVNRGIAGGPAWEPTGGLRLQEGRRRLESLVPGPRESALRALFRKWPLPQPLAAGLLVVDLEAVPVGIGEVDADRHGVVGDAHGDILGLQ